MNSLFNDIDFNLNFLGDHPEQQSDRLSHYFDTAEFNSKFTSSQPHHKDLKVLNINVRSIAANGSNLVAYLGTLNIQFDIICLTETWMNERREIVNHFPDYKCYHSTRPYRDGGGVSILVKPEFSVTEIVSVTSNTDIIECIFVEVSGYGRKLAVGCCYRPHCISDSTYFSEALSNKLHFISRDYQNCVLCGDFNLDLLKIENDYNISRFYDSMSSLAFLPTIDKPTRITNDSISLIDNIFINNPFIYKSGILKFDVTDHLPTFIVLENYFTQPINKMKIDYRLVNDQTLEKLYNKLSGYSYDFVSALDCETAIEKLHKLILSEYDECCPIISRVINRRDHEKPWINHSIKAYISRRQNLFKLFITKVVTRSEYNRYRNFVTDEIRKAKKLYFGDLFIQLRNNIRKTWSVISSVLKPFHQTQKNKGIKSIIFDNVIYERDEDISNLLNEHYSTIGKKISESFSSSNLPCNAHHVTNSLYLQRTSALEVKKIILALRNKSTPRHTYSAKVLKIISDIISTPLACIINKSLQTRHFPNSLKIARVVPIYKGGTVTDINNYRPVSILPLLSKIFERVMFNRLYSFLEKNRILVNCQYGFRKKKSTTEAVMDQMRYIYDNLDDGNTVVSLFLDFSKAFDCIDHKLLLHKLFLCGVRGIALDWFRSYLSSRQQYVSTNNFDSSVKNVTHGVPQGSILGPLLFLVFINDFPQSNSFFKFSLFADDSTLSCRFIENNPSIIKRELSNELIPVNKWLHDNKIKINCEKSKFIVFSHRKTHNITSLRFGNGLIRAASSIKFLGILLDEHLKFKNHVSAISEKISKNIGLLYRLSKCFPSEILKMLYHTLVMPHLSYGIEIWFGAPVTVSCRVIVLQKKIIRAMNSLPFNAHTNTFFKNMNILKLQSLHDFSLALRMFKNNHLATFETNSNFHNYRTRNRNNLVVPRYNLSVTQKNWVYRSINIWNSIPSYIKDCDSVTKFKTNLKSYLINQY